MKTIAITTCILLAAARVLAADAKDTVKTAAKALGDKANYSWKSSIENAGGGGGRGGRGGGPTDGKTEKGGYTHLSMVRGENTTVAVIKGAKAVVKTADGWKTSEELASDDQNPARFMARTFQNYKTPSVVAAELADEAKELKVDGEMIMGALTEAATKARMTFGGGRGGGGNAPEIRDAKGTVKFWVKDGSLSKYQYRVQGTRSFNGNEREVDTTTTVEIKDIGSTKIDVPEDAKKKF